MTLTAIMGFMKDIGKFVAELSVTFIVAMVLSIVFAVVAYFIIGNIGTVDPTTTQWVSTASGVVIGFILGYKLNTLIREHLKTPKSKPKKK